MALTNNLRPFKESFALCRWPLLVPRGCHFGGPFWHLGRTLEDHGSSRMDTRGSGVYSSVLDWFWTLFWMFVWFLRLEISISVWARFQDFFCTDCWIEIRTRGPLENRFSYGMCDKNQLFTEIVVLDLGMNFGRFLEVLGPDFWVVAVLETGLKIDGFW